MDKITVELRNHTPLEIPLEAESVPYQNQNPTKELLTHIVQLGHETVIEHVVFNFRITGISRTLLQEFVRHRIASYTVKSTRYTLVKDIRNINTETDESTMLFVVPDLFKKYPHIYMFYRKHLGMCIENMIHMYNMLSDLKENGETLDDERITDYVKYMLPEAFRTDAFWSVNLRSLRNFLKLRSSKKAHPEIRKLAKMIETIIREKTEYGFLLDNYS